ncbi:MAG TPA: DUF6602 domain-containing protein [Acidimicrobiales bacterium]|nr:DUF6602 domain-containing protein [Acidimicrobiales bacterium]
MSADDRGFDLHDAFMGKEEELLTKLRTGQRNAGHSGVQGAGTEDQWHTMLADILPARYQAIRAFVVDSRGGQSEQIDLAIVDRHFSPLFWEWGGHCYVPAESVYAAFEVKPEINREYLLYGGGKVASVRRLRRTSVPFGWAMGTMPAREVPPILGGFLAGSSGWSPPLGQPLREALADVGNNGQIDLGCVLGAGSFEIPVGQGIDDLVVSDASAALVSFTLTLLHRLQGIGSAPAIDYKAYAGWVGSRPVPQR